MVCFVGVKGGQGTLKEGCVDGGDVDKGPVENIEVD